MVDGVKCGPDGVRCDVFGNLWASSNAGRNVGYSGVTVWSPEGKLLGRIRMPEVCGNVCFGGPKRNRLFMAAASRSTPSTPRPRARRRVDAAARLRNREEKRPGSADLDRARAAHAARAPFGQTDASN